MQEFNELTHSTKTIQDTETFLPPRLHCRETEAFPAAVSVTFGEDVITGHHS